MWDWPLPKLQQIEDETSNCIAILINFDFECFFCRTTVVVSSHGFVADNRSIFDGEQFHHHNYYQYQQKRGAIGSTLTDLELAKEALSQYFDDVDSIRISPTTGGVNNIVQYVDLPNGQHELLRIYNNGCDYQRVKFEHAILEQLNDNDKIQMSFRVPKFLQAIRAVKTGDLTTVVRLSNGADACMCELIPGTLPKLTCAKDLGRAAGELNTALTQVSVDRSLCNVAPYYDMWGVHHAVTQENFIETMRSNLFDETRDAADRMLQETLDIAEKCLGKYQDLPVQLIHGDLHYDNVLIDNYKVPALLDFEFASFDWRALELAIGLSKYAGEEPDAMPYFDDYIDGYANRNSYASGSRSDPRSHQLAHLVQCCLFCGAALGRRRRHFEHHYAH